MKDHNKLYQETIKMLETPVSHSQQEASQQAATLRELIHYHEWRYYIQNDPVISDFEYDQLFSKLKTLENDFPELITNDSPTQRVSTDLTSDFPVVEHLTPTLSLENSYDAEDLAAFDERVRKVAALDADYQISYVAEPKFDGGTIVLVYEDDVLVRAATRGDGIKGEEITNNARKMRSLPLRAAFSKFGIRKAELRGEALIRKDEFERVNENRAKAGETLLANPRNAATGALRVKDGTEISKRKIEVFVYQLGYAEGANGANMLEQLHSHHDNINMLQELGFKVPHEETKLCLNIQEAAEFCDLWEQKRDNYAYEIDGMVLKVDSLRLQDKCGYTAHHPRWAIAYKFSARQATTKLLDVEFQVGRTGAVTPVGKLQPVALAGVMVSNVSLHNEDQIKDKDILIGDTVLVERAGDVIPYVVKSMQELRDGSEKKIQFPTECPACKSVLVRPEGEAVWRCENPDCEAQTVERLIHFASVDAMDIEGLGRSIIERFYAQGWLHGIASIYKLNFEEISQLEGFGKKSAENMAKAIEKSKSNPIYRLLTAFGIRHLGVTMAKTLAASITNVKELCDRTYEEYLTLSDFGPKVAASVHGFFQLEGTRHLLSELEAFGVNLQATDEDRPVAATGLPLSGKSVLFTGTLSTMTRQEAEKKAELAGAKILSGVSAKLNYLIAGENAGSKLEKATKLKIPVLTEQEFEELIKQEPEE